MEAQVAEIAPVGREPEIIPAAEARADLAGDTVVTRGHVLQAIGFRRAI